MTFTIRLEQADGTPAEPPTMQSTVTNWRTGDTIPLGRDRTLRVVGIVVSNEDEPSVLIVEDVANTRCARGEAEPTHPQEAPDLDPVALNGSRSS
jgi:hypothetical protein